MSLPIEATPVPHAPGYGVTPDGQVWSLKSNWRGKGVRALKPFLSADGYQRVHLTIDGKSVGHSVHSLVLSAFVGPRPSPRHQARHLDGARTNNRIENLAWGTARENSDDRVAHGTMLSGSRSPVAKLDEAKVAEIRSRYAIGGVFQRELAAEYGVSRRAIGYVLSGEWWKDAPTGVLGVSESTGPRPTVRPDGRIYRPRKAPEALLTGYDGDVEGVIVVRTHDTELARQLALDALNAYDPDDGWELTPVDLSWGHWRPDRATDGMAWERHADCSGTPAVSFDAEMR